MNNQNTPPLSKEEISRMRREKFIEAFALIQSAAHEINRRNGWWEKRDKVLSILQSHGIDYMPNLMIELTGLSHTELSESVEAARKHPQNTWGLSNKKDTMVRELAGTIVRIMDMAEWLQLPLGEAILEELDANTLRGIRHGGKAA